jgi:hypothetical protein
MLACVNVEYSSKYGKNVEKFEGQMWKSMGGECRKTSLVNSEIWKISAKMELDGCKRSF